MAKSAGESPGSMWSAAGYWMFPIIMEIKHVYTKPYRLQTNGKIERFWKTLKEDFIEDALYQNLDDLKEEMLGFLVYYNNHRPHSAIGGKTPAQCKNM